MSKQIRIYFEVKVENATYQNLWDEAKRLLPKRANDSINCYKKRSQINNLNLYHKTRKEQNKPKAEKRKWDKISKWKQKDNKVNEIKNWFFERQ